MGEINEKFSVGELVLVAHEPCLGCYPEININLKNGGVCCLSADDLHVQRRAVLERLLTPKILSALS